MSTASSNNEPQVSLALSDLKNILASLAEQNAKANAETLRMALEEIHKPTPPTPQQLAEVQARQEERLTNSQSVEEAQQKKKWEQSVCLHEHAGAPPFGGMTHCVFVQEDIPGSPGYIYCQYCEARVRPVGSLRDKKGKYLDPQARYDDALFNTLFQKCAYHGDIS